MSKVKPQAVGRDQRAELFDMWPEQIAQSRMDEIFKTGLHEFIGDFISDNNRLGALITEQYLL